MTRKFKGSNKSEISEANSDFKNITQHPSQKDAKCKTTSNEETSKNSQATKSLVQRKTFSDPVSYSSEGKQSNLRNSPRNKMSLAQDLMECNPSPNILQKLEDDGIFPLKKKSARFVKARYICRLCEYHCDTVDICMRHMQDSRHVQLKEVKMLEGMLRNFPYVVQPQIEAITGLINSIVEEQRLTLADMEKREKVKLELESKLKKLVPGCSLQISGSVLSGYALKTSDLNLNVLVPEEVKTATALLAVLKIVTQCGIYCEIENELSFSYPCVHFTHKPTMIRIEVGVSSPHAYNTNTLLYHYNTLDSRVAPVVVAFRYWAKLCRIDQQQMGTLPAHTFPLLALHFLQQTKPAVIPSLHALYSDGNQTEKYLKPDELNPPWKSTNTDSLGKLWVDLFKFYSVDFRTAHIVVTLRFLEPLLRKERMWGKKMAIEDPFQTKRNLSRSVGITTMFDYIVLCIKFTYQYFITPQMSFGPLYKKVYGKSSSIDENDKSSQPTASMIMKFEAVSEVENDQDQDMDHENDQETNDTSLEENLKKDISSEFFSFEKTRFVEDIVVDSSINESQIPPLESVSTTLSIIPWYTAVILMKQLKKEHLHFNFSVKNFSFGKRPPVYCCLCQKTGHDKFNCTEYDLPPLRPLGMISPRYFDILSYIFVDLKNECASTAKEIAERDTIVSELQSFIRQSFDGATLKLFGSSVNGFGFGQSDLDICLMFEGHSTGEQFDHIKVIEEIAEKLKKYRDCRMVLPITTAKVPIVKFIVKRHNLDADLSLYNTLALENTKLLHTYAKIDARVQILGYAMKYFAKLCDMGDASRGSLSSYAYTLMVIHYLQQCKPPVIPVLQKLYPPNKPPPVNLIDNWNAWFFSDLKKLPEVWSGFNKNVQNPGILWLNMFRYFTEVFNWKEHVVTINQLEPLTRLEKLWTTQCIAIEDPFDLSHNLGGGLSRKMNTFIMKSFIKGREVFGAGMEAPPPGFGYENLVTFLFDTRRLTDGSPPNDRGCRYCGKIGHLVRDCPHKKSRKRNEEGGGGGTTTPKQHRINNDENGKPQGPIIRDRVLQMLPKGTHIVDLLPDHFEVLELFSASEECRERLIRLGYRFYPIQWFDPHKIKKGVVVLKIPCSKHQQPFFGLFMSKVSALATRIYRETVENDILPSLKIFLTREELLPKLEELSITRSEQHFYAQPDPLMPTLNSPPRVIVPPVISRTFYSKSSREKNISV